MAVLKYYNTATSAWEYIAASTTANFTTWKKTMAGGETSVSGTDDNSVTLSYTVGLEQVFINGALQARGSDYVATNGTSVTGLSALSVNDIVSVVCYAPFNVTNTYTKSETDDIAAAAPGLRMIVPSSVAVGSGSGSANAAGFVTFSGASSVSLNGVFNSTYDNYKIVFTLTSVTADTTITAKVRSGVTDNSSTLYSYAMPGLTNGGTNAPESSGPTSAGWLVTYSDSALSHYSSASIDLYKPFLAVYTSGTITMTNSSFSSVLRANSGGWWHEVSSSFDGISFISSSGNITGTVAVYGYKD